MENLPILTLIGYIKNTFDTAIKYYADKEIKTYLKNNEESPNYSSKPEILLRKYEGCIRQHISVIFIILI